MSAEKIYIQGELYVRKRFFPITEEAKEQLEREFEGYLDEYDNDEISVLELYKQIKADYESLEIYRGNSYAYSDSIYQLAIKDGRFMLVNVRFPDMKESFVVTPEVLDECFVSLREFIRNAHFIGEMGYIENPAFKDMHSLTDENQCIVLYHGVEGVLVIMDGDIVFLDERYGEVDWVYEGGMVRSPDESYIHQLSLQLKNNIDDYIKFQSEE